MEEKITVRIGLEYTKEEAEYRGLSEGDRVRSLYYTTLDAVQIDADTDNERYQTTLFIVPDTGQLLVHTRHERQDAGISYSLREIESQDLSISGEYEWIGRRIGFDRTLTIEEAISGNFDLTHAYDDGEDERDFSPNQPPA